jgi:sulfide:quinone oxidoreductase
MVTLIVQNIAAGHKAQPLRVVECHLPADMATPARLSCGCRDTTAKRQLDEEGQAGDLAKIVFEKYFIYKMKHGTSEPIYEK